MKLRLLLVAAFALCLSAQAQEPTPPPAVGETLLHPLSITIGGSSSLSFSATAQERAVQSVELQIEQRRAVQAASAETPGLWRASFWKYLPTSTGGSLNSPTTSDIDPAITPGYLLLSDRVLERKVSAADKTTAVLFGQ